MDCESHRQTNRAPTLSSIEYLILELELDTLKFRCFGIRNEHQISGEFP
jgi:hypothetical protein